LQHRRSVHCFLRVRAPRGFGLLELLLTLALVTVVLGTLMLASFRSTGATERLTRLTNGRQNARTAVQLIEREIRMAGSGWGRIPVYGNDSSGAADTLQAVLPGYAGVSSSDSLLLVGASQTATTTTTPMLSASSALIVQSVTGFDVGDLVLVTNGSSAHKFQITGTDAAARRLDHGLGANYNAPDGLATTWPPGGYGAGSSVLKLTISSYTYDPVTQRSPALVRHEYGQPPQAVAYNVSGFHVWYQLEDGTWTRHPANMASVVSISPAVLTRVARPGRPAFQDSAWVAVQPRTF
jgi:type II secretory pathway pseudopilin PulG